MVVALALIVILFQVWTDGILLQAAQRHQHRSAERLHPDPGDRHDDRHHRRPHRPVGRLDRRRSSGPMSAVLMIHHDMPWPVAVVLCLLLGAAIGAWQGFWIAYVGIPSFIVTLAGMLVFRGATQYPARGTVDRPVPPQLQTGQQRLPARGRRATPSTTGSPCILGVLVMVAAVCQQVRQRRTAGPLRLRRARPPRWFVAQVRRHRRRARRLHAAARQLPRRARGRHHPGGAVRRLRLRDAQHGHRPAGLRGRRQRARRRGCPA